MQTEARRLPDLVSIGPAMLRDLKLLRIRSVAQLARKNPRRMYRDLCRLTGQKQDICCLDVFTAAVAQARNPQLPIEQCQWWYWSRQRKLAVIASARGEVTGKTGVRPATLPSWWSQYRERIGVPARAARVGRW